MRLRCFGRSKCEARVKRRAWTNRRRANAPPRRDAVSAASKRAPTMREACARSRTFKSSSPADPAAIPSRCSRVTSRVKFVVGNGCGARRAPRRGRAPALAATPTPAPKPKPTRVVIHLPNVPLHTEVVVEVNKKGQVVRVKSTKPSKIASFNVQTYGNALQMWIRKPDGSATVGLYRVTYDYDPKTQNVTRHIALDLGRRELGKRRRRGQRHGRDGTQTGRGGAPRRSAESKSSSTNCRRSTKFAGRRLPSRRRSRRRQRRCRR